MKLDDKVRARIADLINRGDWLRDTNEMNPNSQDDQFECHGWLTSASNIIATIFPDERSPHRSAAKAGAGVGGIGYRVGVVNAVLKAVLDDVDAGVVVSVADNARAGVFDDFLDHADHYLRGGKVPQAGVVSGVVFEDTIRRACTKNGIVEKGESLDKLISALVQSNLMNEVKAKRARAAAGVRTQATHAQWSEFEGRDVEATIATTRELIELLLTN